MTPQPPRSYTRVAAAIVVAAVVVAVAILATSSVGTTVTKTVPEPTTTTITYTTTLTLSQGALVEQCVVTEYHVWSTQSVSGTYTLGGTSTQSYPVTTYQTSASVSQTVGYAITTTNYYSGTLTGAIAVWNSTACTYISG